MFTFTLHRAASLPLGLMAAMACANFAAAQQGHRPATDTTPLLKTAQGTPTSAPALAPRVVPKTKANGIEAELDRASAIARSADGKTRVIPPSSALRRALMAKAKGSVLPQLKPGKLTRVTKTTEYPHGAFGVFSNGCTGSMVGKNAVLTSAYCLYDAKNKQWPDVTWFAPGYDAGQVPFGNLKIKDKWIPKPFVDNNDQVYAYALVQLEDAAAGDKTGWVGFAAEADGKIKQMTYVGYPPSVKPEFSMWQGVCNVSKREPTYLSFFCPIKGADAGAPLLHTFQGEDFPRVLSIQMGEEGKGQWGMRLSDNAVLTLGEWIKQMGGGGGETETSTDDTNTDDGGENGECNCGDRQPVPN